MQTFDVVVIGSGNAGLTAAVTAQKTGKKTLLVERHNIPGGCATSFVRGDFEFEVALHQLSGLGTEQSPFIMRHVFEQLGVMDKVEFVQEHALYRLTIPNQIDITLPASWSGIRKILQERFPLESENIDQFMLACEKVSVESFTTLPQAQKNNSTELLEQFCHYFQRYGLRTAHDVLNEFFTDQTLISIVAAYWFYSGVPPKELLFSDLAVMIYAYAIFKPWHIKGGSQAMSNALLESFLESGGEVRFNCSVDKIITAHQAVKSVKLEDGSEIQCKAVISNASPILVFNEMLDQPSPLQVQQDFKSRRMGTSAFVIYLGLDCAPEQLNITAPSTFISSTMDWSETYANMQSFDSPISGMLTCYNFDDPDAAPQGKSQVVLVCLQYADVWEKVKAEDYAKTKYRFADELINLIEQVYPNLRQHIQEVEVATPLTMMRYLNTPGGAIYGFRQTPEDSSLIRECLNHIQGLYFAGAWTSMGGFQPTYMAGVATAKAAAQQLDKISEQEFSYV